MDMKNIGPRGEAGVTSAPSGSTNVSGGSKGGARTRVPPGPNSFNFMQFLGNFGKILCWHPLESWRYHLWEILNPPLNVKYGYN